jgi:hypothetical protein
MHRKRQNRQPNTYFMTLTMSPVRELRANLSRHSSFFLARISRGEGMTARFPGKHQLLSIVPDSTTPDLNGEPRDRLGPHLRYSVEIKARPPAM